MHKELKGREDILNYELNIIQNNAKGIIVPVKTHTNKYEIWQLNNKLQKIKKQKHQIRWIGNHPKAYLDAYAYVLLFGCLHLENSFIEFKGIIYSIAKKCLDLAEQKILVQFLCLIQFSKDRYSFLKKNAYVEEILIKILLFLEEKNQKTQDNNDRTSVQNEQSQVQIPERTNKISGYRSYLDKNQIEKNFNEIYVKFGQIFQFISLEGNQEDAFIFKVFNSYETCIMIEKQCFFIIETHEISSKSQQAEEQSHIFSIKKQIKDNLFDIKYFDEINDFQEQNSYLKTPQFRRNFEKNLQEENQIIFNSIKKQALKDQSSSFLDSRVHNRKIFDKMWPRTETDQAILAEFINQVNSHQLENFQLEQEKINIKISHQKQSSKDNGSPFIESKKQINQQIIKILNEKSIFFNNIKEQIEQFRKKIERNYEQTQKNNNFRKVSLDYVCCDSEENFQEKTCSKEQNTMRYQKMSKKKSLQDLRRRKDLHSQANFQLNPSKLEKICENQENINQESTPPSFQNKQHLSEKSQSISRNEEIFKKVPDCPSKKRNFEWLKSSKIRFNEMKLRKQKQKSKSANQYNQQKGIYINHHANLKNLKAEKNPHLSLNHSPCKITSSKIIDSNLFRPFISFPTNIKICSSPTSLHNSFLKNPNLTNYQKSS